MNVVYYSTRRGLAPQVAAAIHLRILPMEHPPNWFEWRRIPYRQGFTARDWGRLVFVGWRDGHGIFVMAYPPRNGPLVAKVINSIQELMDPGKTHFQLVDAGAGGDVFPWRGHTVPAAVRELYPHLVELVLGVERGLRG
ncbi:MAG TPA: DUF3189 family protein [Firmicutes bacterium]|jgi:hypothetical protein|nr:DUF3189 family protein [Bacillota bacterium]HOQ23991.1 DUF3189 family protein [Bacillota bacterium]HPT67390.1 DUF3189 family protein [Bacillota bacterium]